jgi:hypothetical protein
MEIAANSAAALTTSNDVKSPLKSGIAPRSRSASRK